MTGGATKSNSVAFKVDDRLFEFLRRMPNASEFIRHAIHSYLRSACPLCDGRGVVPAGVGEHFAPVLAEFGVIRCHNPKCGEQEAIRPGLEVPPPPDRRRWQQFFRGGPFFCRRCFDTLPACGECGWHLTAEQLSTHDHHQPDARANTPPAAADPPGDCES